MVDRRLQAWKDQYWAKRNEEDRLSAEIYGKPRGSEERIEKEKRIAQLRAECVILDRYIRGANGWETYG